MPNARRFALAALLLGGSAVLAGAVVSLSTPAYAGARVPPASALPWPVTTAAADRRPPFVLLYVDSHCSHCSRAAVLVDSFVAARRLRGIIMSGETPGDADAYTRRLGLRLPIATDSSFVLLHAIGTRSVPTMVLFHADGSRQLVVGFTGDRQYRKTLTEFER